MSNITFKHQTHTTHFSIFYNSFRDKNLLKKIKELVEEVYKNNRELFDIKDDFQANIYFYDDIKKFKKENLKKGDNYSVTKEYKREIRAIHPEKLMTDSSYTGYCY